MRVAYEDVRFKHTNELATELMSCSFEEELSKSMNSELEDPTTEADAQATLVQEHPPSNTPLAMPLKASLLVTASDTPEETPKLTDRPEGEQKDIGEYATAFRNDDLRHLQHGKMLDRDLSRELDNIYEVIGSLEKLVRAEGVQIECLQETGGQF